MSALQPFDLAAATADVPICECTGERVTEWARLGDRIVYIDTSGLTVETDLRGCLSGGYQILCMAEPYEPTYEQIRSFCQAAALERNMNPLSFDPREMAIGRHALRLLHAGGAL